jgi:hypothetical protein
MWLKSTGPVKLLAFLPLVMALTIYIRAALEAHHLARDSVTLRR